MKARVWTNQYPWLRRWCKVRGHRWKAIWQAAHDSDTYDAMQCTRCREIRWRTRC